MCRPNKSSRARRGAGAARTALPAPAVPEAVSIGAAPIEPGPAGITMAGGAAADDAAAGRRTARGAGAGAAAAGGVSAAGGVPAAGEAAGAWGLVAGRPGTGAAGAAGRGVAARNRGGEDAPAAPDDVPGPLAADGNSRTLPVEGNS